MVVIREVEGPEAGAAEGRLRTSASRGSDGGADDDEWLSEEPLSDEKAKAKGGGSKTTSPGKVELVI